MIVINLSITKEVDLVEKMSYVIIRERYTKKSTTYFLNVKVV